MACPIIWDEFFCGATRRFNPKAGIAAATESKLSLESGDVSTPLRYIGPSLLFQRSITKKTHAKPTRVWNVRAIAVGDGSVGRYGARLLSGEFFGSSAMDGDHTSFHLIDPKTLSLCEREESLCTWPLRAVFGKPEGSTGSALIWLNHRFWLDRMLPAGTLLTITDASFGNGVRCFPGWPSSSGDRWLVHRRFK